MATQEVGMFEVIQKSMQLLQVEFLYTYNGKSHVSQKSPSIEMGKACLINPKDLSVPNGATLRLKACVGIGPDQTAKEEFIFNQGSNLTAVYSFTDGRLKFIGIRK
jgi:hypothetical protein